MRAGGVNNMKNYKIAVAGTGYTDQCISRFVVSVFLYEHILRRRINKSTAGTGSGRGRLQLGQKIDNLLQYVKKIEVDRRKITYTEFVF